MNTAGIKQGDIVYVEKKQGWKFYAHVEAKEGKEIKLKPFDTSGPTTTYRSATAHEIKKHWKQVGVKSKCLT